MVLDDPPVADTADDHPVELHVPPAVGSVQGPSAGDPVTFGDLLVHLEAQRIEQRLVKRDRLATLVMASEDHALDRVDELLVVVLSDAVESARTDVLDRVARDHGLRSQRLRFHDADPYARFAESSGGSQRTANAGQRRSDRAAARPHGALTPVAPSSRSF